MENNDIKNLLEKLDEKIKEILLENGENELSAEHAFTRSIRYWQYAVDEVITEADYWMDAEYLNDSEYRCSLDYILKLLSRSNKVSESDLNFLKKQVHDLDRKIVTRLVFIDYCIWGTEIEKRRNYSFPKDWWWYAWPKFAVDRGEVKIEGNIIPNPFLDENGKVNF